MGYRLSLVTEMEENSGFLRVTFAEQYFYGEILQCRDTITTYH